MGKLCRGHGPAEQVALSFRTVLGLKVCALCLGFDALGNYQVLEALSHANDGAHDWRVIGIAGDPVDERLVNFQDINGKLLKIAEAGIAGAEVIHRKVNPHQLEPLQYGGGGLGILHKDAFGQLQFEISPFQASFRESRPQTFDKTLIAKLQGGNVDGNRQWWQSPVLPGARLPAGFAPHPAADLNDEATIFGDGYSWAAAGSSLTRSIFEGEIGVVIVRQQASEQHFSILSVWRTVR